MISCWNISSALSITQWIAPEVISFFGSIIVFIVLKKGSSVTVNNESQEDGLPQPQPTELENELSPEKWKLLLGVGKVVSLIALCATGALQPSVLSFVYYAVFLGAATWWGCNRELERCENHSYEGKSHYSYDFFQSIRNSSACHTLLFECPHYLVLSVPKSLASRVSRAELNNSEVRLRIFQLFPFY